MDIENPIRMFFQKFARENFTNIDRFFYYKFKEYYYSAKMLSSITPADILETESIFDKKQRQKRTNRYDLKSISAENQAKQIAAEIFTNTYF